MTLLRAKAVWNGFNGGPGVNILHFGGIPEVTSDAPQQIVDALGTFYMALRTGIPASVSVTIDGQLELVDETTGRIEDIFTATPPAKAQGVATGGYSSGSGLCIHWLTSDYVDGRMVRGRSFIAPLAASAYAPDGTLDSSFHTAALTAAQNLRANESIQLSIFRRPKQVGTVLGIAGTQHRASGVRIADKGAYLSSRRD
jgi:hypothetical protein